MSSITAKPQQSQLTIGQIEQKLALMLKRPVKVKVNRNRRSFVRVLKNQPSLIYLSLHALFLSASEKVICSLASFIKGDRAARARLNYHIQTCDLKIEKQENQKRNLIGNCYDLKVLYTKVKDRYFPKIEGLDITWFGKPNSKAKRSITLGSFDRGQKLIKIHRLLDRPEVPQFFVEFVLYHETLHHLFQPMLDQKGRRLELHTKEFKKAEQAFSDYQLCMDWQRRHLFSLFE